VIRAKFPYLTNAGVQLLTALLSPDPARRPSADEVLQHPYFDESPRAIPRALFPTFPSKAGQERRRRVEPNAPKRGDKPGLDGGEVDFSGIFAGRENEERGAGFMLRTG
jgi:cell division cycle 2-like